jgi:hypothetical protein
MYVIKDERDNICLHGRVFQEAKDAGRMCKVLNDKIPEVCQDEGEFYYVEYVEDDSEISSHPPLYEATLQ